MIINIGMQVRITKGGNNITDKKAVLTYERS